MATVPPPAGHGRTVCVTGAGGFIGSWIVKLLLERGYTVRGMSRRPTGDLKNNHLCKLDGAKDRLVLLQADLLDIVSLGAAFEGCDGVFHVASPISDDPEQMLGPAIEGTKNVVNAAADAGVAAVVFTSSIGSVYMNPHHRPDRIMDETCWSDLDYCVSTKNWYCYAKTVAETEALRIAGERGLRLAVMNVAMVLGPLLGPDVHLTAKHILRFVTGRTKAFPNAAHAYVDVRDVAEAHVRAFESAAASGRFMCAGSTLHRGELCQIIADLFPGYPVPTRCKDEASPRKKWYRLSNRRLRELGVEFTPVRRSIHDYVKSLQEMGVIPVVPCSIKDVDAYAKSCRGNEDAGDGNAPNAASKL